MIMHAYNQSSGAVLIIRALLLAAAPLQLQLLHLKATLELQPAKVPSSETLLIIIQVLSIL